jgi:S-phase kinase-associated protein 1
MSAFAGGIEEGIIFIASDDARFEVPMAVVKMSSYAKGYIEENPEEKELQVSLVTGDVLGKILEYCNHYQADPMKEIAKPLANTDMNEIVQPFYANYINNLSQEQLKLLSRAANFMGIAPLLSLCAAKIASLIRGKSPEEIRANLGLSTNFTPAQEEKLKTENAWAKDL